MKLQIYFLRKLTSTGNQTFLRKFYTTKIWSYTVARVYYIEILQLIANRTPVTLLEQKL